MSPSRPYTLVFDGMCTVCNRSADLVRSWDKRGLIEVLPAQEPGVMARFPWIPQSAFNDSIQFVGPGGATWQGAQAIEELLGVLPRGRPIAWIFRIPLVRVVAERFYRWFARNRYRLGCGAHCTVRR